MGATASSGPGIALKTEAIGLAVMTELPLVIVNVQRGGPSTGLPTKTEQADLMQAMFGRNGECPLPVVAAAQPGRLLQRRLRRLASGHSLHDSGHAAHRRLHRQRRRTVARSRGRFAPQIIVKHPQGSENGDIFHPYARDERLARPWAIARHARLDAPHRRARKARHHRQRQLRAGEPRAHGEPACPQDGRHCRRPAAAGSRRTRPAAKCWW